jgi:CRP-like cAMP-binding protein
MSTTLAGLIQHPFARQLWPDHIQKLATMASDVHFSPGELIYREGDHSSFFYLLVTGTVSLEVVPPGHPVRIATLYEGEALGWSSVLGDGGKRFQARALEEVQALAFDGARLRHACEEDFAFGFFFMKALFGVVAERLQATRAQIIGTYSPVAAAAEE